MIETVFQIIGVVGFGYFFLVGFFHTMRRLFETEAQK